MKHYLFALLTTGLLVVGCNSNAPKSNEEETTAKEIEAIDSTTYEMERAREDIENLSEDLDTLMRDL
ncbi:MAG: hypothetical protein R6U66_02155 [Bacteroidales bacterium]